jgi:GNAT superfamily N-acetyltransferase
MAEFGLRPYRDADFEFAFEVGKRSMGAYVVEQFGPWVDADHRRQLAETLQPELHFIVTQQGLDVALLSHERCATHWQLHKLFIAPEHQGRGLGTALVRWLQQQAQGLALPVRLRLLRVNPAKRLYERLGFAVVDEAPERFFMEWRPRT